MRSRLAFIGVLGLDLLGAIACGRVGNDSTPADALLTDSTPVADAAVDATADATSDAGPRVADSKADFSVEQGKGGWRYLYQEPNAPLKELTDEDGGWWWMDHDKKWTIIGPDFMHPDVHGKRDAMGGTPNAGVQFPVRRWVADVAGAADIEYAVAKSGIGGDGVLARVLVDGVQLIEHTVAFNDERGFAGTLHAPLRVGSTVDFVVEGLANEGADSTRFTAKITVH